MLKHIFLLTVVFLSATPLFAQNTDDLIISEYIEGSSYNKYIEVYNGTGEAVDLANYEIHIFSNGNEDINNPSLEVALAEANILADEETLVLGHTSAELYDSPGIEHGNINFNGDDAVTLFKISTETYIDVFGCIGQDPGDAWTAGGDLTTKDMTLRRKNTITTGATIEDNQAGFNTLETEWTAIAKDDVSGLGTHSGTVTYALAPDVSDNLHVYPDKTSNQLIVESPQKPEEIRICNLTGKLIILEKVGDTRRINISNLKPGIYIATILFENGRGKSLKFRKK